jgi:hypothetical protein
MIRTMLFPVLLALFTFTSCEKSESDFSNNDCIKIKVIAEICGTAVIQFQDEKHFDLGEKGWSQDGGKTVYDNVAFTVLSCEDMEFLAKEHNGNVSNKLLNVTINDNFEMGSCAVCLAIIAGPPTKKVNIKIAKNSCPTIQNG